MSRESPTAFVAELARPAGVAKNSTTGRGLGVRWLTVAVPGHLRLAISMSRPLTRMDEARVERAVKLLRLAVDAATSELRNPTLTGGIRVIRGLIEMKLGGVGVVANPSLTCLGDPVRVDGRSG